MVEAARLCAAAPNGTILCTEVTHRSASGRPEGAFGPLQHLDLKGLPMLEARELHWKPAADSRRAGLVIETLGELRASRNDVALELGGPKEHRVLAVLTASANHVVNIDSIVDALWAENPPRTAARSVHAYVARLRRAIEPARRAGTGPKVLVTEGRAYRLVLDRAAIDSCRFEDLVERGRAS